MPLTAGEKGTTHENVVPLDAYASRTGRFIGMIGIAEKWAEGKLGIDHRKSVPPTQSGRKSE